MYVNLNMVEDLIRQLPTILDQSYDDLCEEVAVGKGRRVILAASYVNTVCKSVKGKFKLSDVQQKQLETRLHEAAYAINAVIECHEGSEMVIGSPTTMKQAYKLLDQMAKRLNTTVLALRRER